ncbi:TOBE domain-containing protein [Paucibacter sp. R3-3]|uniref:TOBE domain-containing protein n=1 Tax=Roseateles agri TaxID=3098619 RepID=A0ABU5DG17_9BURK|nr:TOBE domain-containing protein [Paucibacter sp. R3-3]MDY0744660.1 TOBE domain-containing protein [Paucibacter sp. R3-3]
MKTSARNQFAGKVSAIREGAINDEVELEVAGGHKIVATVTRESRNSMKLAAGASAFALVKASSIILMSDCDGVRLSARNQLKGKVAKVTDGAVNTEVVLELAGGIQVAVIITLASAQAMGLAQGSEALAIFKASSVILGVAA